MGLTSHVIQLGLSRVLIVGAYQFYFWCQRHPLFEPRQLATRLDEHIPYLPGWVWIYSLLYYPAILYVNLVLDSPAQFIRVAPSYLMLLSLQMGVFLVFPVRTPLRWRKAGPAASLSERFLAFVQDVDAPSNSFPGMHTSVAMLTALHLYRHLGAAAFVLPVLIGLSCLFTKQHYLVDVPAGAALGWFAHTLYPALLAS